MDNREDAERARYEAMSTRELFELGWPEPTDYALAWYAQRPASERLRMRMQPLKALVDPAFRNCNPALPEEDIWKGLMAALELARRARAAGSKQTGRWVWEEIKNKQPCLGTKLQIAHELQQQSGITAKRTTGDNVS
jgi:hypothetical protein